MTAISNQTKGIARATAKQYLGIAADDTTQDTTLDALIDRANMYIENYLGFPIEPGAFVDTSYLNAYGPVIALPRLDIDSITSVSLDGAYAIPSDCYLFDTSGVLRVLNNGFFLAGVYTIAYMAGATSLPTFADCLGITAAYLQTQARAGADVMLRGPLLSVNIPNVYQATFRDPRKEPAASPMLPDMVTSLLAQFKAPTV